MMYAKDEQGEYRVPNKWIEAWAGGGSYVAGWSLMELREYADGSHRVVTLDTVYTHENPQHWDMHAIWLRANSALKGVCELNMVAVKRLRLAKTP